MLVLSHSDRFGIYFHQFGQRVHQPAAYGYGSTHGHVVFMIVIIDPDEETLREYEKKQQDEKNRQELLQQLKGRCV